MLNRLLHFCLIVLICCHVNAVSGQGSQILPPHPAMRYDVDEDSVLPTPSGTDMTLGNLTFYQTGNPDSQVALILVHDVFGLHRHVKFVADKIGEGGFLVLVPDFYHGRPYDVENFPPPGFQNEVDYLFRRNNSTWSQVVKPDIANIMKFFNGSVNSYGIMGFCWGAKMALYAASDPEYPKIQGVGLIHPSRVEKSDFEEATNPMILLPSKDEPDMIPFLRILHEKDMRSEHKRFRDMKHGFVGAKSDFTNILVRRRVDEVIRRVINFFGKVTRSHPK